MQKQKNARRIINTYTGPIEQRILPIMARALPRWVVPDHLTVLGLVAALIITTGYILTWYSRFWLLLSNFGFILHWFADSLDGTLARVRHAERERYGYFVDHISDACSTVLVCIGFGLSPLMQIESALFLALGYLLLNVYAHVDAYSERVFRISFAKIGPTEIRIILIAVNTLLIFWNPVIIHFENSIFSAVDIGAVIISTIFICVFVIASVKAAIRLDWEARLQKKNKKRPH